MIKFLKMLRRGKRNRETSICETRKTELDLEPFTSSFDDGIDSKKTTLGESHDIKSLEKIVLGGEDDFIQKLEKWKQSDSDHSSDDEKPEEESIHKAEIVAVTVEKKPVWVDEDDDTEIQIKKSRKLFRITNVEHGQSLKSDQYVHKLKEHFEKSVRTPAPKWANLNKAAKRDVDSGSDDEDDDLMRRTGSYIGSSINLPKDVLHFKQVCNLTEYNHIKAAINTTEFHKKAQILLVSGYTQRVMLFQIDGKENPLLETVLFDGFPIETAHFSADGDRIIVGSNMYSYFYYYDMLSDKAVKVPRIRCKIGLEQQKLGRFCVSPDNQVLAFGGPFGKIHLLSAKTYDYVCTLKMNGSVGAFCFSSSGNSLYSHGDDGEVYVWDVRRRECIHKFYDEGCVKGTSLSVSQNDAFLACGSNTGVVNIYDTTSAISDFRPKPLKSIMSLTTSSTRLCFNSTNEILASCSSMKQNSIRMFHIPSRTTFQNFPEERENLRKINSLDFSVNSGYFCCGNDKGQAYLYRLFHYENF